MDRRKAIRLALAALFATAIALTTASAVSAQDNPPVIARAEQCLRQNVDRVVRIEPDVQSAANFLVEFACAAEVSRAAKYEHNLMLAQALGSMSTVFHSAPKPAKAPAAGPGSPPLPATPPAPASPPPPFEMRPTVIRTPAIWWRRRVRVRHPTRSSA